VVVITLAVQSLNEWLLKLESDQKSANQNLKSVRRSTNLPSDLNLLPQILQKKKYPIALELRPERDPTSLLLFLLRCIPSEHLAKSRGSVLLLKSGFDRRKGATEAVHGCLLSALLPDGMFSLAGSNSYSSRSGWRVDVG